MGMWVFHGLTAVALVAFAAGAVRRFRYWRKIASTDGQPRLSAALRAGAKALVAPGALAALLLDGLLFRRLWRASRYRWLIHVFIAWSFAGLFLVGSLGDMVASLGVPLSKDAAWFAATNDTFGLLLVAGIVLAAGRRLFPAQPHPATLFDDGLALGLLGFLAVGGFFVEAVRYLEGTAGASTAAYAGYGLSRALNPLNANWTVVHDWLWWSHGLVALAFVAYLPYSKLFHMFTAPATIVRGAAMGQTGLTPLPLVELPVAGRPAFTIGQMMEFDACVGCGECLRACSSYYVKQDEAATLVGMIRQGRSLFASPGPLSGLVGNGSAVSEAAWGRFQTGVFACTLCGRCQEVCPIGIKTRSLAMTMREDLATARCMVPKNMGMARDAVVDEGNVFRFPNEDRAMWADFLDDVPGDVTTKEHADILYFVGCVSSFSPAIQEIPQAFLQVLLKAGMDVALLAEKERCCGFPLIMGGLASDARDLIDHNMAELKRLGAKTVVFNCPSCYYTWKKYYPVEGIRLAHATEVIQDLVDEGKLVFESGAMPVTYHDPCDLGRGMGQYDAPRNVLRSFAPEDYIELVPSKGAALCCGGGGDVEMWDPDLVAGVNTMLTDAIVESGANLLVQACPQCKRVTQRGLEGRGSKIRTMDIAELALEFGTFVQQPLEVSAGVEGVRDGKG
jgi:heterodisulfide reductase subunit D